MGVFNTATGEITSKVDIPAYKGTVDNQESDPPVTKHFQEGKTSPRIETFGNTEETFKFSTMDSGSASLVRFIGGAVATLDGKTTWSKGTSKSGQKAGFEFETLDGAICIAYVSVVGKRNNKLTEDSIRLIDVTCTPIETGTAIPSVRWIDPVVV